MQHVSKLVEQGDDIIVRQKRNASAIGGRKIAYQIPHRRDDVTIEILSSNALINPRTASLAAAGVQINVETTDERVVATADVKILHRFVPARNGLDNAEFHTVKLIRKCEQPILRAFHWKILAQQIVRQGIPITLQFLEIVRSIPSLQGLVGQLAQSIQLGFSRKPRLPDQFSQEFEHFVR